MPSDAVSPRLAFAGTHGHFHLLRAEDRYYGIPEYLQPTGIHFDRAILSHAGVLSAPTLAELEQQLERVDPSIFKPQPAGMCDGYQIVEFRGSFHGIPRLGADTELTLNETKRDGSTISGRTLEDVTAQIRQPKTGVPVEFAGWLPVYERWGNCGRHPQFKHTNQPPPGYRFTRSAKSWRPQPTRWQRGLNRLCGRVSALLTAVFLLLRPFTGIFRGNAQCGLRTRLRVLASALDLFFMLCRRGVGIVTAARFVRSRHFQSQLLIADSPGLVFLTSMPYTYGQNPWVIEIEDPTTLFYPFIQNGNTVRCELREAPCFPAVKALLEADACKGILTHMQSTSRMVAKLFHSDIIQRKITYTPLGVRLPSRWQEHEQTDDIHLVFINSWCQEPNNFFVRGGLDLLEAFAILRERYPRVRLTLRTHLPALQERYRRIMETGWVRVIDRFLPSEEMEGLLASSHVFLLPAARVHIVSLLQAMSYGLAIVTSDGWGIDEYVRHEHNGLIVPGRYGKVSWADEEAGMLRENYTPMYRPDPDVVDGIVASVSRLIEDRALRQRLGQTARSDVQMHYTLERWNAGLKEAFDRALLPPLASANKPDHPGDGSQPCSRCA